MAYSAWDCTLLTIWSLARFRGLCGPDPVPLALSPAEREDAERAAAGLALVIPAHNEASTPEDSEAFAKNIAEIIQLTPRAAPLFILFDSPSAQRESEQAVVRRARQMLEEAGHGPQCGRIRVVEYRDKPPQLRSKPGSLSLWLKDHGHAFEYMMVLDADSSLRPIGARDLEGTDVVHRLLFAMERYAPRPHLIQTSIRVTGGRTIFGWLEEEESSASSFHAGIFALIFGNQAPCFGHNFICRPSEFSRHLRTDYLSHDMIESASLAAHGKSCFMTQAAATSERPEEPASAWLRRDARWARGCGQWWHYLLRKRPPWRPSVYLLLALSNYLAQYGGCAAILLACLAYRHDMTLMHAAAPAYFLLAIVVSAPLITKKLAGRSLRTVIVASVLRLLLFTGLIWPRTVAFLLGPVRARWSPRPFRNAQIRCNPLWDAAQMLPISLLALALWPRAACDNPGFGPAMLQFALGAMMLSPITVALMSWPIGGRGLQNG